MKKSSIVELTFKTDMYNNCGLIFFNFQLLREGNWVHEKNTALERKMALQKKLSNIFLKLQTFAVLAVVEIIGRNCKVRSQKCELGQGPWNVHSVKCLSTLRKSNFAKWSGKCKMW